MNIQFFAEGIPKGQPRSRAFSRGGHASVYDPGTAENWKSQVAVAGKEKRPKMPIEGPVSLTLTFSFPRPKKHYGTGKKASTLRLDAPRTHLGKPDADNLAKAVMDAMTELQFWKDDGQVWSLMVQKIYAASRPGCHIHLTS